MEKFVYFPSGREFEFVTDHKAIEELKKKTEFGSARVARWFERLEKFNFKVKYKEGNKMIVPDALSRAVPDYEEGEVINSINDRIMKIHKKVGHRKGIQNELQREKININNGNLKDILKHCLECQRKEAKRYKVKGYVKTYYPGEKVGVDLLVIDKNQYIRVGIDYFSRYIFTKLITTKSAENFLRFLKEINKQISIKKLVCDNGREFNNDKVKDWSKASGIVLEYSIPYFHESNDRVERANQTIREAIKKTKGPIKVKLERITKAYNEAKHRGTGMSPIEGLKKKIMKR